MTEPSIRRLRAGEWEQWRAVRLAALETDPSAFGSTLEREMAYTDAHWQEWTAALASSTDRCMFVAAAPDGGFRACTGAFRHDIDPSCATVVSVWVAPQSRGNGLAGRLLDAVAAWAQPSGIKRLDLLVVEANVAAISAYRAAGYEATGVTIPLRRDPSVLEIEMVRTLGD